MYGIQTLSVGAHRLQSMVADCAAASKSSDARDKYFETYVGQFAPGSSKALRSELPALEAGADQQEDALQCFLCFWATGGASIVSICRVCLGGGAAENEVVPRRASSSSSSSSLLEKRRRCACRILWYGHLFSVCFLLSGSAVMLARSVDGNMRSANTREQMAENVDRQNGVNAHALSALFKESRRIIIASRSALF